MAAPAHHDFRFYTRAQRAGVAQQVEDVVGQALGAVQVDALAVQLVLGVDDIAQGAEQHFPGAGDHLAIDESVGRGIEQFQAYATVLLVNTHFEVLVGVENGLGVIDMGAGIENGQGALAKEGVGTAGAGFAQLLHFPLGKGLQAALGANRGVDDVSLGHAWVSLGGAANREGRGTGWSLTCGVELYVEGVCRGKSMGWSLARVEGGGDSQGGGRHMSVIGQLCV